MNREKSAKNRFFTRFRTIGIAGLAAMLATGAGTLSGCIGKSELKTGRAVDGDNYIIAESGFKSAFILAVDTYASNDAEADAKMFAELLKTEYSADIDVKKSEMIYDNAKYILSFGSSDVRESLALQLELRDNEYAIKAQEREDGTVVISLAFKGGLARRKALDLLLTEFTDAEAKQIAVPKGTDIKGSVSPDDLIITTDVSLRDPCILNVDGTYYVYGTGWVYYKNTSGNLQGPWEGPFQCVTEKPAESDSQYWAPEVHAYNGAYYMFTTYHKASNDHRGCVIMRSETPEGPFEMWSDGHVTPNDWDCIDGTLYVDPEGQPWMVFVHEWTCRPDGVGLMSVAKLSPDLKELISEPVDIFRADGASWGTGGTITDGPWLYTTRSGELLMIWSNFDDAGYSVGIVRSSNGKIDGNWSHLDYQLFTKKVSMNYDGGHGMIFRDNDGQLYLSIHSPNSKDGNRKTLAIMVPIKEFGDMLLWDFGE